jgi:hypothetical protein
MKRFKQFAKRLFTPRSLPTLIVIIGAIIISILSFGGQIPIDQAILAVLALLAVDGLVERLDLLAGIEEDVQAIRETLTPAIRADAFLKRRKDFPRMERLISEARNEIWVAGVTLDTMATLARTFESKVQQGLNIRLLALAPDGDALPLASQYHASSPDFTTTRIASNLATLASRLASGKDGSVEIRVIDRVFPTGYFITDPSSPQGQMIVQLYLYHIDAEEAPLFELSRADDAEWFSVYMRQFEQAWSEGTVFPLAQDETK